ncbi:MAG: hypothetical protein ACYTBX_14040 [Planctomycetota bacterium]|jgi:hypothetical protein
MPGKYKAIKISEQGNLTDEKDNPITCPVRNGDCTYTCAWFSIEDRVIRCQNTVVGAIRGKPIRSFRLSMGPEVFDLDKAPSMGLEADND